MLGKNLIQAAAGAAGGDVLGVEDVFSTWLYTGNGSTQTITNGIDLSGEGGLVWLKNRSSATSHRLSDTARGVNKQLATNSTAAETSFTTFLTGFNTDGFNIANDSDVNANGSNYASWTFRKAEKFFDVVTYTGDNTENRQIPHSLGSVPGVVIVKSLSTGNWSFWHRTFSSTDINVFLNTTTAAAVQGNFSSNGTASFTSTTFPVSYAGAGGVNTSGQTYVAYVFAHDAGGFGDSGDESVIKCGSFNTTTGVHDENLGWEPQWLLIKDHVNGGSWRIFDSARGFTVGLDADGASSYSKELIPNTTGVEATQQCAVSPTGFRLDTNNWGTSRSYIYIAIRRGPMKTPTVGTEVFDTFLHNNPSNTNGSTFPHGYAFAPDWMVTKARTAGGLEGASAQTRLTGTAYLRPNLLNAEDNSVNNYWAIPDQTNVYVGGDNRLNGSSGNTYAYWGFQRAPGFFDVVAYTGTGGTQNVSHNLTVAPEFFIHKTRSNSFEWWCWHSGLGNVSGYIQLNSNSAAGSSTGIWGSGFTSSQFTVNYGLSTAGRTFITYLFATLPGISKVGSYTGTGTTLNIDCGFTAGARFVLIKRTDSTGDWYVYDSARGIVSGNDPYLLMNSDALEVTSTDYIDPLSSGFQITSTAPAAINASGGSYIFLAIA
jgi:hypothetical protein